MADPFCGTRISPNTIADLELTLTLRILSC